MNVQYWRLNKSLYRLAMLIPLMGLGVALSGFILSGQNQSSGETYMNRIVINTDLGKHQISRHIYGHFSEHLGHCIYGGYWVGEKSSIPNIRGIRRDVVEALRKIKIPNLSWPGGCFADEYHWMNGIGSRDQRPSMINTHWGGVTEDNSFGTHEFMDLCEQLDTEPYICGNVGSGTVNEMQQWIEYMTSDGISPLTEMRKKNGCEKAWKIKYWGVGNENWGCGGNMTADYYADQYRRYSTYCRNFGDNRLYKIACGANSGDYNWTKVLMEKAGRQMDGLSLHYYTVVHDWAHKGSATLFDEKEWFLALKKSMYMEELVAKHSAIMDMYDPEKRVGLIVDEWGIWHDVEPGTNPGFLYQQNTLRDALVASTTLDILNQHSDRVRMANLAQTVNVLQSLILTQDEKVVLTPTYYVFEMYQVHHDATLLPIELTTEQYRYSDQSIPLISASASLDQNKCIHISLTNRDPNNSVQLTCEVRGSVVQKVSGRILTAPVMNSYNDFNNSERIKPASFNDFSIKHNILSITLPSKSIVVLNLE